MFQPDCALVTNVGPAHVGYFGSVRKIVREKRELLRSLGGDATAFVNVEDPHAGMLMRGVKASVETFGLTRGNTFPDRVTRREVDHTEFTLQGRLIRARVLGTHGVVNAVAAAAVGKHFGLSIDEIKRGIEAFEGEAGRGRIHRHGGVTFIDESYNANPLSVSASLVYLGGIETAGRKIFIFADMLELGRSSNRYHREMAQVVLEQGIDIVFTYGEKARAIGSAARASGMPTGNVRSFLEKRELLSELVQELRDGDVLLVKGSRGMKLDEVVEQLEAINPGS